MRILHLSDTHLAERSGLDEDGVDARAALAGILDAARHVEAIAAVVVTGDIADDGSTTAYADARAVLAAWAGERQAALVFTMGNHDRRPEFMAELGTGHFDATGRDVGRLLAESEGERTAASEVGGWRVVSLDTSVPGLGYGWVSSAQLDGLADVLTIPAAHGTVLALHHPPIAADVKVQRVLGLRNADELGEVIAGSDVRLVLCGHFHLQLSGQLAGVPVQVVPGVASRADLTAVPGTERAVHGASAAVIDLGPRGVTSYLLHARDARAGETVYELTEAELAEVLRRLGPESRSGR